MRVTCLLLLCIFVIGSTGGRVKRQDAPNLTENCFRCLCSLHGCEVNRGCSNGFCGPYYIPEVYWEDAGTPTLYDGDDPTSEEAYQSCTSDLLCSVRTIRNYAAKYAKDCNGDGVINCFDYMMINYNGGPNCTPPLNRTSDGTRLLRRYRKCRL